MSQKQHIIANTKAKKWRVAETRYSKYYKHVCIRNPSNCLIEDITGLQATITADKKTLASFLLVSNQSIDFSGKHKALDCLVFEAF